MVYKPHLVDCDNQILAKDKISRFQWHKFAVADFCQYRNNVQNKPPARRSKNQISSVSWWINWHHSCFYQADDSKYIIP